jgi:alanine dehydrogenase
LESSRAPSHSHPTYQVDEVTHYCVTNMPGAVPVTATHALTNATLPYIQLLASGWHRAIECHEGLRAGLQVAAGRLTSAPVAASQGRASVPAREALAELVSAS